MSLLPPPSEPVVVPAEPARRLPEGLALAAAAILGAVIVLAGSLILIRARASNDAEVTAEEGAEAIAPPIEVPSPEGGGGSEGGFGDLPDPSDDAAEGTPPTSEPEPEPIEPEPRVDPLDCPDGVDLVICDAAVFVQEARGRPFRTFPVVEILEDETFDRELLADFDDYREAFDIDEVTLTALGLLEPEVSLADIFRDSLEVGVVGFYDPTIERLVVRGNDLSLYAQLVLVHELVHAFDDQWFDLDRDDFVDDDAEYGFSAVVEGNASRVENLWRNQLSSQDQLKLTQEEITALSPDDIERLLALPIIVQDLQASPYTDGEVFTNELASAGGEAAVDDALTDPPTTSEEVLHPGTSRVADPEIDVPAPPADGEIVDEGRLGELLVRFWLGRLAGDGWGGDRYVTWRADGASCIAVDLIGDTENETIELDAAADAWAALGSADRVVEPTTVQGRNAVRVTACA